MTGSIIFACIHNSCRSQMAEGFARSILPKSIKVVSAGTEPASDVNPLAIEVMQEAGIDISGQKPKILTTKMLKGATHFISMGCGVLDSCPVPLVQGEIEIEDWEIDDPAGKDIDAFRVARDLIEEKIRDLAARLQNST
jgi:arsenate reductase